MAPPNIEYEGKTYTPLEWQEFVGANLVSKHQSLIEATRRSIETNENPAVKKEREAFLEHLLSLVPSVGALAAQIAKEVEDLK